MSEIDESVELLRPVHTPTLLNDEEHAAHARQTIRFAAVEVLTVLPGHFNSMQELLTRASAQTDEVDPGARDKVSAAISILRSVVKEGLEWTERLAELCEKPPEQTTTLSRNQPPATTSNPPFEQLGPSSPN